jgi:hypothetical protein
MSDDRPSGVDVDRLTVHVLLRERQLDRKLTALRAMATQTSAAMAALDEATYAEIVAEEAFVEATAFPVFVDAQASEAAR